MILMSITMFTLGMLALMDTIYNYGSIFRVIFSFVLIGFSVLLFAKAKSLPFFDETDTLHSTNDDSAARTDKQTATQPRKERKPENVNR
jgi:cytochrome c biogenesis protein CcdA